MKEIINVAKSSIPPFEEYCEEIKSIWTNHWLTNMGEKHNALENKLMKYLDTKHISLFTNGHLALEAILKVLDLNGEVITSPYTFASTTHAIVRCGLKPVFCDIEPDYYTIDVNKIEALINKNTCAIMPIHVYGNLADNEALEALAKKYNLKLIYDAAHAFGVFKNGLSVANMGDVSMFSFHATKVFNTIEGGALTYKDEALKQKIDLEKNFGIPGHDKVVYSGGNAKMNEFQAAMGICNLKYVDQNIEARGELYNHYMQRLGGKQGIKLCKPQANVKPNYAYMPVLFESVNRDVVFEALKLNGINARRYFYPLTNTFPCYNFTADNTPIAYNVSKSILTLPLYADLSHEDVDRVCDVIIKEL
ncbi:MAG: DegT/DnrJ/EryC1/StrS family aminotransferase [Christensenellaceae bacterium]|nr:DegT/DnrJ/EryC1/StrS family aminotransferase [Christensenellaceae bacterium]